MADGWALEVEGLSRTFSSGPRRNRRVVEAVRSVSFTVAAGERLAFIGPNGAGKSTSIKMLTGILHPSAGRARVLGLVPWARRRDLARRIGTLFGQRSQLWAELPARDSLGMLGAIYGIDDRDLVGRIGELGELFEAEELFDRPLKTLSLGQRMRCELAACLLHEPELLFLDEPTIGLDLLAKQVFRELLVRINDEVGTTVFLTSHDVADIEHVAHRAIVVNHGEVISDEPVAEMRRTLLATKRIEVGLGSVADVAEVTPRLGPGVEVVSAGETVWRLDVDTTRRPVREVLDVLLASVSIADLTVVDPPLERVIGEIYARPR